MTVSRVAIAFLAGILISTSAHHVSAQIRTCQDQGIDFAGGVYWRAEEFPLSIYIHDEMPEFLKAETVLAAQTWNSFLGFTAFRVYQISTEEGVLLLKYKTKNSVVVFIDLLDPNQLAVTQLLGKEDKFLGIGALVVNSLYLPLFKNYHRVMVHELGHVLGLEHDNTEPSSVMYPSASNTPSGWYIEHIDRHYIRSYASGQPTECL